MKVHFSPTTCTKFASCPIRTNCKFVNLSSFQYIKRNERTFLFSSCSVLKPLSSLLKLALFVYLFSDFLPDVFKRFMLTKRI